MTDRNQDWHCRVCRKYLFSTYPRDPSPDDATLFCEEHKPSPNQKVPNETERPMACAHMNFAATVGVARITKDGDPASPVLYYMAEIRIACAECKQPFQFLGLEPGLDTAGARVSLDGLEANIAIAPEGEKPNPFQRMAYGIKEHN